MHPSRQPHRRRVLAALAVALLAVAAVPTAEAALNGERDYRASFGYLPGLGGATFTMASGELDAVVPNAQGSFGLFTTGGAQLTGLTRVCWTGTIRQCTDSAAGGLSVHVLPGGSFGFRVPGGADARLEADHALALFSDLSRGSDLNGLELGRSLVAPAVGGRMSFSSLPAIQATLLADPTSEDGGALAATHDSTVVEVREGETVRASMTGKVDPVTFAGRPTLAPVVLELAVMPFEGAGAVARVKPATQEAAATGLTVERINGLMEQLYSANEGQALEADGINAAAFGPYADAAAALFRGAVLSLPTEGNTSHSVQELSFARTSQLEVRGLPDSGLAWSGKAALDVRDGHVQGAPGLFGWSFLSLPWWGWVLWALAIGVFVTRLVLKPEKHHPKWDRFKWVGWVASPLAFLLVFVLWDFEMRAVLGLSLFSGNASGQVLLLVLLLQLLTFAFLSFAAIAPLRLLLRNGSMLLRQGTFMGLAGAAASLLGFLIGAGILRSALDLAISAVLGSIA